MMVALASANYSPEPDKEKANVIWKLWFAEIFLLNLPVVDISVLTGESCYCWHIQLVFFLSRITTTITCPNN